MTVSRWYIPNDGYRGSQTNPDGQSLSNHPAPKVPPPVLYGPNTMGGVINILTMKPEKPIEGSYGAGNYQWPFRKPEPGFQDGPFLCYGRGLGPGCLIISGCPMNSHPSHTAWSSTAILKMGAQGTIQTCKVFQRHSKPVLRLQMAMNTPSGSPCQERKGVAH